MTKAKNVGALGLSDEDFHTAWAKAKGKVGRLMTRYGGNSKTWKKRAERLGLLGEIKEVDNPTASVIMSIIKEIEEEGLALQKRLLILEELQTRLLRMLDRKD